jgi:hypothetical protein
MGVGSEGMKYGHHTRPTMPWVALRVSTQARIQAYNHRRR